MSSQQVDASAASVRAEDAYPERMDGAAVEFTRGEARGEFHVPIEKYVRASRKLDLSGIDWSAAAAPLDPEALATLTYMMDVEGYTLVYLRDLLNTSVIDDPEIGRFLTLWAYEEMFHSEALERFLAAQGVLFTPERRADLRRKEKWLDRTLMYAGGLLSRMSPAFGAIYLTWGAINELTTLLGYGLLAEEANHPVLSELLHRIVKDERRHFSFYFWQAKKALAAHPLARKVVRFAVNRFWQPVGNGVKHEREVRRMIGYLLRAKRGPATAVEIDETIASLPGLSGFRGMQRYVEELPAQYRSAAAA